MSWATLQRPLVVGVAALALITGCGDDNDKKDTEDAGGGTQVDAGDTEDDSGAPSIDAGRDAGPPPQQDASTDAAPLTDASDPSDATPPTDAGDSGVSLVPLPADGDRLSVCYAEGDCKGDDLVCYAPDQQRPGFCTDDCTTSADCAPLGGVPTTCSEDGQCRIDCGGSDAGLGMCPTNMVCRNISSPLLAPQYRCTYPNGTGSRASATLQECNRRHGTGDCQDNRTCHVPGGFATTQDITGYCAPTCAAPTDCATPTGTTAAPVCSVTGFCEFDCSGRGAVCPTGMNCVDNQYCRFLERE